MTWLNQVIAYNDPIVPNNKLQLGIPAYGRNWGRKVNSSEICPDGALNTSSIELQNMPALIDAHGATPARHEQSGEMYFSYDVVATGYSTVPIPAPPYVPPAHVVPAVPGAAKRTTATGLQPALRLTPPTTQLSCTVRHFVYYPDATTHPAARPGRARRRLVGRGDLGSRLRDRRRLCGAGQHHAVGYAWAVTLANVTPLTP